MGFLAKLFGSNKVVQPVSVNDSNFRKEIIESDVPVLLDIWSDSCVPCKKLEPIIMDLAQRYEGRLKVAELHPERGPQTMARLGVRGTPTVIYFKEGREVERVVGFRGSLYHSEFIDHELLDPPAAVAAVG